MESEDFVNKMKAITFKINESDKYEYGKDYILNLSKSY